MMTITSIFKPISLISVYANYGYDINNLDNSPEAEYIGGKREDDTTEMYGFLVGSYQQDVPDNDQDDTKRPRLIEFAKSVQATHLGVTVLSTNGTAIPANFTTYLVLIFHNNFRILLGLRHLGRVKFL